MKINEVDKVTTLAPAECITAIAADGSLIQIPVSELGKVMAQVMPVATSGVKGLLGDQQFIEIIKSLKGKETIGGEIVDGIRDTGIHSVTSAMPSSGNRWGILVVCNSGYYILQLIFGAAGPAYRYAHGQKAEWSAWIAL